MGDGAEMAREHEFDREIEWYYQQEQAMVHEQMEADRTHLNNLPDDLFIQYILMNGRQKNMDEIIPDDAFQAYTIARNIYINGWTPTKKQRIAITNVYLHSVYRMH